MPPLVARGSAWGCGGQAGRDEAGGECTIEPRLSWPTTRTGALKNETVFVFGSRIGLFVAFSRLSKSLQMPGDAFGVGDVKTPRQATFL